MANAIVGKWGQIINNDLQQKSSGKNFMILEGEVALAAQKGAGEQGVVVTIVDFGKGLGCGVTAGIGNGDRTSGKRSEAAKLRTTVASSLVKTTNH